MVSLKKYLAYSFVFLSFLLLAAGKVNASQPCCKNGKMSTCPDLGGGLSYDLSGCQGGLLPVDPVLPIDPIGPILPIEAECDLGDVQYKPKGDCDTSTRSCCSDLTWSEWDGECSGSSSCGTNECWNGSTCVTKPTTTACTCTNGTCSLTYTCSSGSGWKSSKSCTCKSGYSKNSSGECVHSTCVKGCNSGYYMREISSGVNKGQCECCAASCNLCGGGICTCVAYGVSKPLYTTCCAENSYTYTIYTLPSDFSSCADFGQSAFGKAYVTRTCPSGCGNDGSLL